ncbi:mechanosensitive ion channel family protein [Peijinzhouia sedimentorum]
MKSKSDLFNKKELRRRGFFILKLIILFSLLYFRNSYSNQLREWNIPSSLIDGLLFYLSGALLISIGRIVLVYFYLKRKNRNSEFKDTFLLGINRIASFLTNFILILALLITSGVDVEKFFTSITIVAAAIAILSKDYINNMINGLIMMFGDQLALNDYIKIGEYNGKIIDINFLNIVLENIDGDKILIPNSAIITGQLISYSELSLRKVTFGFELPSNHSITDEALNAAILEGISEHNSLLVENSDNLLIKEIKKEAIAYEFSVELSRKNDQAKGKILRKIKEVIQTVIKNSEQIENER